jgi:hypothetical protein
VIDDVIINHALNQITQNNIMVQNSTNTRQSTFVVTPQNVDSLTTRPLGVPLSFGGSYFTNTNVTFIRSINDQVNNTNVVSLNSNLHKKRINTPQDAMDLDPQLVSETINRLKTEQATLNCWHRHSAMVK